MATVNLSVVIPDDQLPRVQTAFKAKAATPANPTPTNAQAVEWFRATIIIPAIKDVVRIYEDAQAAAANSNVTPT